MNTTKNMMNQKIDRHFILKWFQFIFSWIILICFWSEGFTQLQEYNHPELTWRTIETEHFYIHFHQHTTRTASLVAKIGEDIYNPITSLYEYEPDGKIHFVVKDYDDNANGAAYYYNNKVEVWAPSADFLLRGDHNWLRNVVTHEFSHMISLGAARKLTRRIPAMYLQWLGYEKESRPDVIHGFPNTIVFFPLAGTVIPMWYAEGMAQFQRAGLDYDTWDTHRDMLLRTAVVEDKLLSIHEMEIFGKNSLGNERTYNQGYGLTLYLAHQYGDEVLRKLTKAMKKPLRMNFSEAVNQVLGKNNNEIYEEWTDWLKSGYETTIDRIQNDMVQGEIIEENGIGNLYPVWSPDGQKIIYLSNQGRDYLSQQSVWIIDKDLKNRKRLSIQTNSAVSWSPDGTKIVFAQKIRDTKKSNFYDLHIYDIESGKKRRITFSKRARQPTWSFDNKSIVCVIENDGTSNLALIGCDGKGFHQITHFKNGEQLFLPRWTPHGDQILFALYDAKGIGRDIGIVDSSGLNFHYLVHTEHDERDPFLSPEGDILYYSSDRTGIFNLYRLNLESGVHEQISNVIGGAFMPTVNQQGQVIYSAFNADGYKLARMNHIETIDSNDVCHISPYRSLIDQGINQRWTIARYDDQNIPEFKSKPYKPIYSKLQFLPRFFLDYPNRIKLGTYFFGSDILEKFSIFGTAAANSQLDLDVFGMVEYRGFYPTIFLEVYEQTRHKTEKELGITYDILFNLMEIDLGAEWKLNDQNTLRSAFIYGRYKSSGTIIDEYQQAFGKFSSTYHIGRELSVHWKHRNIPVSMLSGIAPRNGRTLNLEIRRAWQRFGVGFNISEEYGTLVEEYKSYPYTQFSLDWWEFFPVPIGVHSLALRVRGGYIDRSVYSFYNLYGGGLDGLKGYPYYSIEGRKLLQLSAAYRFPIWRKMGLEFLFLDFENLFLSLYGDAGNGWNENKFDFKTWKKDVGIQLRLEFFAYYGYPLKFFFDATYGIDHFTHMDEHYGGEWRFYTGLLFEFWDMLEFKNQRFLN